MEKEKSPPPIRNKKTEIKEKQLVSIIGNVKAEKRGRGSTMAKAGRATEDTPSNRLRCLKGECESAWHLGRRKSNWQAVIQFLTNVAA